MRCLGLIGFALILTPSLGCQKSDTDCLARLGKKLSQRCQAGLGDLRSRIDHSWKTVKSEPPLEERVKLRLRWDKELAEQAFEVVTEGNEITLRGSVDSIGAKQRAVELASATRGVARVLDQLEIKIAPPPKTPDPPMPDDGPKLLPPEGFIPGPG